MNTNTNIGWQYYRNYFHNENLTKSNLESDETEKKYKIKNKDLVETPYEIDSLNIYYQKSDNSFRLLTTYPGLLIGSGYKHEVAAKGELKLGFFFDYTTGLPIIPGSSIKGLLRSAFPQWEKDKKTPEDKKWIKTFWIYSLKAEAKIELDELLGKSKEEKEIIKEEITRLELAIFEGIENNKSSKLEDKFYSIYNRDIFFDAIITKQGKNNWIIGTDSITPHIKEDKTYEQSMLRNPVPIPFLKILPNVEFSFHFQLTDNIISKDKKEKLFKDILLTLGIGAKTNVGYGQFIMSDNKTKNIIKHKTTEFNEDIPTKVIPYLIAKKEFIGIVNNFDDSFYEMLFTINSNLQFTIVKKKDYKHFKDNNININDKVKLIVNSDFDGSGILNCKIVLNS